MSDRKTRALRSIEIATHCVSDLSACIPAYTDLLDYQLIDAGHLPESLTKAWNTPAMTGMSTRSCSPPAEQRFPPIYRKPATAGGYWPPVTQGWIATEILTTDPDELIEKLQGTSFTHIGGPADLYPSPKSARALQMAGPAGELMYFTRILPVAAASGLHGAKSFVDRPFIMVVGGLSMAEIHAFYSGVLGLRVSEPDPFRIGQMSRVLGLNPMTAYPVSLARIPGRSFLIELEELPSYIERRNVPEGPVARGPRDGQL